MNDCNKNQSYWIFQKHKQFYAAQEKTDGWWKFAEWAIRVMINYCPKLFPGMTADR